MFKTIFLCVNDLAFFDSEGFFLGFANDDSVLVGYTSQYLAVYVPLAIGVDCWYVYNFGYSHSILFD